MPGKVGVVTGGGSGHEPAFLGYVGPGLVDAVAVGEIFSSPQDQPAISPLAGVLCLPILFAAGMSLFDAHGSDHVRADAREVFDVTGAGDTVIATLAAMLAAKPYASKPLGSLRP